MDEKFLLETKTAQRLYDEHAKNMPIIDYHCHISPEDIARDRKYKNITEVWLYGDHYKWRQMRACGIDEKYITGNAGDYEKFYAFAQIMPLLIGNPMYNWCQLELKRYFDIDTELSGDTAADIWERANKKLERFSVRRIIEQSNVKALCTTDDPVSNLEWHRMITEDTSFNVKVLPAFRPDRAIALEKDNFADYIGALSNCVGFEINDMKSLRTALTRRLDFFCEQGCRAADCGVERVPFAKAEESELDLIIKKALSGIKPDKSQEDKYKTAVMRFLFAEYRRKDIVSELHFGVIRSINSDMYSRIGADSGFDVIAPSDMGSLPVFFDSLNSENALPKTIVFSLNAEDNARICAICASFCEKSVKSKIQQGSAWWFNDSKEGILKQLKTFASLLPLGVFVGMLTDSRSFLSYTRHEYFRRILCNYIGSLVENGEYPDNDNVGKIVENICFNNANDFFGLGLTS